MIHDAFDHKELVLHQIIFNKYKSKTSLDLPVTGKDTLLIQYKGGAGMFNIGQFSWITQIPRKTLRYYDEIDLLKPTHIDDSNKYRYYSSEAVFKANMIKLLRKCNFSIDEIRSYLTLIAKDHQKGLQTLLENKRRELENMVQDIQDTLNEIENLKTNIKEKKMPIISEVTLESQNVISMRGEGIYQEIIPKYILSLFEYIKNNKLTCLGAPVFICHDKEYKETGADIEVVIPVAEKVKDNLVKNYQLNGGKFAKLLLQGSYKKLWNAYEELYSWIEKNKKTISGPTREVYLNSPQEVPEEQLLTEILVPIA